MSDQALTAEIQRLQSLQALGITVYHPRFRLPGAKPSVQGPWPDAGLAPRVEQLRAAAAPAEVLHTPRRVEPPVSAPVKPESTPAPASAPAARSTAAASAVPAAPRAAESAQTAVQNFQLLFLQIDGDIAIVNQIPALARPQLQDKQLALLTNLLRWLGKPVPAQQPRVFRWPLPGLEHMAASMSAETSLLHFLEQANSERGFRFLLQLGPQAVTAASNTWRSFATHSLDEMLALPTLKREAWQTLLPLHAALNAKA